MNLQRFLLITFLFLTFTFASHSQDAPDVSLFDELGNPNCEILWFSLDVFTQQLVAESNSTALIEVSGKTNDIFNNFYWDSMIRGYFARRNIPKERWSISRTALDNERRVKFWLIPAGAQPLKIEAANWTMDYQPGTKPFIFTNGESYAVENGVCLEVDEIALLAKALEFNSNARVNVVLIVRSNREYLRRKRRITKELVDDYSISGSRIRLFKKVSSKPNPHGIDPTTEYWLIP